MIGRRFSGPSLSREGHRPSPLSPFTHPQDPLLRQVADWIAYPHEEHFHQSSLSAAFRLVRGESKEFTTRYLAGSRIIGAPSFDPSALTAHVILTRHQTVDPSGDGAKQIRSAKVLGYRDLNADGTFVFDDLSLGEYTVEIRE